MPASTQQVIPSARFGQYRVLEKIGQGGMAEVFRAEVVDAHGELRTVVLKLLRPEHAHDYAELLDFEADLMGLLDHPNLVGRLEVGRFGERRFLAMEDVYGGDLGQLLRAHHGQHEHLPLHVGLRILIEVLHGLAAFHQLCTRQGDPLGLIHCDVNPANIFVSADGEVKLGDFGVASATAGHLVPSGLVEGTTVGKLHYLSPEQAAGEPATQQSDLFSVGVVLFEVAAGYRPFEGVDTQDVLNQIYLARLDLPAALGPDPLVPVLQRALARQPRDRYRTAGELCGDLVRYQLDQGLQCTRAAVADHVARVLEVAI